MEKQSDTPKTDAVQKADSDLGWGSMVIVPKGHPPCDPLELARQLERSHTELKKAFDAASKAAEYLGNILNDMDAVSDDNIAYTAPSFEAINRYRDKED